MVDRLTLSPPILRGFQSTNILQVTLTNARKLENWIYKRALFPHQLVAFSYLWLFFDWGKSLNIYAFYTSLFMGGSKWRKDILKPICFNTGDRWSYLQAHGILFSLIRSVYSPWTLFQLRKIFKYLLFIHQFIQRWKHVMEGHFETNMFQKWGLIWDFSGLWRHFETNTFQHWGLIILFKSAFWIPFESFRYIDILYSHTYKSCYS